MILTTLTANLILIAIFH